VHLFFILNRLPQILLRCLNFDFLLSLFQVSLPLELLACCFFLMQVLLEIMLDSGIINLNPPSEGLCCRRFQHIRESSFKESFLFVEIACLVDPRVETACNLHVSGSSDEIRHNFLAQTLHL
jgi:hypothetical protein